MVHIIKTVTKLLRRYTTTPSRSTLDPKHTFCTSTADLDEWIYITSLNTSHHAHETASISTLDLNEQHHSTTSISTDTPPILDSLDHILDNIQLLTDIVAEYPILFEAEHLSLAESLVRLADCFRQTLIQVQSAVNEDVRVAEEVNGRSEQDHGGFDG